MALFFSAEAKEQAPVAEMERMRVELQRLKDVDRVRSKYGNIKSEEIDQRLAEEKDMDRRRAESKEIDATTRQNEIRIDAETRALACKLVKDGKMIISLGGKRITSLTPDLILLCPECSKPQAELSERAYQFAKIWYWAAPSSIVDAFTVYSARSPLTEQAIRAHTQYNCIYCHKPVRGVIQMVVV